MKTRMKLTLSRLLRWQCPLQVRAQSRYFPPGTLPTNRPRKDQLLVWLPACSGSSLPSTWSGDRRDLWSSPLTSWSWRWGGRSRRWPRRSRRTRRCCRTALYIQCPRTCLFERRLGRNEETSPLYRGERTAWRSLPKAPITDMTKMIKIYIWNCVNDKCRKGRCLHVSFRVSANINFGCCLKCNASDIL